jgi:tetratricopeptide (TPR) repeat protein
VTTHLIDAETGARHGGGDIHVQDHQELKLRMNELVKQTVAKPEDQAKIQQAGKENEKLLNDARKLYASGKYKEAADTSREGLKRMPDSVAFQTVLTQSEQAAQKAALEETRKQQLAKQQSEAAAAKKKQEELALKAEAARRKAEEEAKTKDAAAKRAQEQQKLRAYGTLIAQARTASQQGHYDQAASLLQSAAALQPSESVQRDLAQARARGEEAKKAKLAKDQAARETALREQHEQQLAKAKTKVEEERRRREAEDAARRKELLARDQTAAAQLIEQGKQLLGKQQYEPAIAVFANAKALHATGEVDKLLAQAQEGKARLDAQKKGEQARAELEKKLAEEKAQREKADADAKRKQQAYTALVEQAQKALAEKRYADALSKYQEADKLFHTDAVVSGIKQAEDGMAQASARTEAEKRQQLEAQKQAEEKKRAEMERQQRATAYQNAIKAGNDALTVKRYDEAIKAFTEAGRLSPGDKAAAAGLQQAERAKAAAQATANAESKRKEEMQKRLADYNLLMKQAQTALAGKQYAEAAKLFGDALKLMPGDVAARKGQTDAQRLLDIERTESRQKEEQKKRQAEYARLMNAGQAALAARRYEDAVKAYGDALKLMPGDAAASKALAEANKALDAAKKPMPKTPPPPPAAYTRALMNAAALEKQQKWADAVRWYKEALRLVPGDSKATTSQEFAQHMDDGQKHAAARKFADAVKDYEAALKVIPNQPDATAALKRAREGKP